MLVMSLAYHIKTIVMKKVIAVMLQGKQNENTAVFTQTIQALVKAGHHIDLITNEDNATLFCSEDKVSQHIIAGKRSSNPLANGFVYLKTQAKLFTTVLKMAKAGTPVYISAIHPFAAAIAGKIRNAKVIYQLEDAALKAGLAERFLHAVINHTAQQVVFTSTILKDHLKLSVKKQTVIYAALPAADIKQAKHTFNQSHGNQPFTVSMVAPVCANKGIAEFLTMAVEMPHLNFELVATGNTENLKKYFPQGPIPANLSIIGEQDDVSAFFDRAGVVVNLSNNKTMLEPMDANILQAMNHGKPVIVPQTGATKELISTQKHGVAIDVTHLDVIMATIDTLSKSASLYNFISAACKKQAALYTPEHFYKQVASVFKGQPQSIYSTLDQFFGSTFLTAPQLNKQQAA
jgi:glycosyltransferase involved in cell wall biosynthesis